MKEFIVAPSLLAADFSQLKLELQRLSESGAQWVHVDVMDGHFVPNLTLGPPIVKALRGATDLVLDVHLMIENPDQYIKDFSDAGSDVITFHVEASDDPVKTIQLIKALDCKVGISLKPATPLSQIENLLDKVDLVLVMTVNPGFGGQSFMHDQVEKITQLRLLREQNSYSYLIEVDGGVSNETYSHCVDADVLVAGSYVFKNAEKGDSPGELSYKKAIESIGSLSYTQDK